MRGKIGQKGFAKYEEIMQRKSKQIGWELIVRRQKESAIRSGKQEVRSNEASIFDAIFLYFSGSSKAGSFHSLLILLQHKKKA